ncbi:hypothetical protein KA093_01305 [Candidatus Saccharibacteria bacterium]|nr:hypothetical protein [Candidatus Saccharibacteria bacterium]
MKRRTVFKPATPEDLRIHWRMLANLQSIQWEFPHSVGSLPGSHLIDNVTPHISAESEQFYLLDLKSAFPSVDTDFALRAVYDGIRTRRGRDEAAEAARFMVETSYMGRTQDEKPDKMMYGLLQGLPCSPLFFDIISQALDMRLRRHLQRVFGDDVVYTRYIDDLTFSSRRAAFTRRRRKDIVAQIETLPGYIVNHDKTRCQSLGRGTLTVTGLDMRRNRKWPTDRRVLVAPSGSQLASVEQEINEMTRKLREDLPITLSEKAHFYGMGSILHMAGDPSKSPMSSVRTLKRRFREVDKELKKLPSGRLF